MNDFFIFDLVFVSLGFFFGPLGFGCGVVGSSLLSLSYYSSLDAVGVIDRRRLVHRFGLVFISADNLSVICARAET